jgi:hypothetical protein
MRTSSSATLASFPFSTVRVACERCGHRAHYRKDALVRQYGGGLTLAELLEKVAGCPEQGACDVAFVNLHSRIRRKLQPDHLDGLLGIPPTL